jgi:hypothetical protein
VTRVPAAKSPPSFVKGRLVRLHGLCLLAGATLSACDAGDGSGVTSSATSQDAGSGADDEGGVAPEAGTTDEGDGGFTPAPHPALPQVLALGGPVLATPKIQPILYASDTGASDIVAFLAELAATTYWSDVTSEYGVGPVTILPAIMLTAAPPAAISDATLQSNLVSNTSGASPAWGAADANTIYFFAMPQGTTDTYGGGTSCTDFGGYHSTVTSGSVTVAYAVVAYCPGFDGAGVDITAVRTSNASHELVEAATDPFLRSRPAYAQEDDGDIVWEAATGGEVADMCTFDDDALFVPPGSKYTIQRSWSNAAAKSFQNPCAPRGTPAPYFNSFPALTAVKISARGTLVDTKGVSIPIGQSKTIDVNLVSTGPMPGPWTIHAYDYGYYTGGPTNLGLTLDKASGKNGDVVHLTIKVNGSNARLGGEAFLLLSEYGTPNTADYQSNMAMGLVTN